ncbi:MAG: LytTR family DNA-binding domain-containing protein [Bacteroidales bacterium]|nr:LytTR family DNA-binding domain-containing protein [Bacteroidales bacterium]MDD4602712.1 LytTR family DNA-binding domain-containing protein [Bacteroidales bacterium]
MIRCLAIDDEMLALDLIEDNIKKVPFLELVKTCKSALEAMEVMRFQPIDLIFLDIQMPDISGIQLLKSLTHKPLVVFTTAYSNYAREGFDLDVIDYLLKPYSFQRFIKAVNKVREYLDLRELAISHENSKEILTSSHFLFVRADYKLVKIDLNDILYIEGLKDYVKIYTGNKPIITQMSMKSLEEKLPARDFIRVHRSFIIAFNKIDYIQKQTLSIGNKEIPVSEHYRDQLFNIINNEKHSE